MFEIERIFGIFYDGMGEEGSLTFTKYELAPDRLGRKGVHAGAGKYYVRIKLAEQASNGGCSADGVHVKVFHLKTALLVIPSPSAEQGPG